MKTPRASLAHMEPLSARLQRPARPPAISHKEIAALLNIDYRSLARKIASDATAPKPLYSTGNGRTQRNTWYNAAEVKAWIASMKDND